MVITAQRTMPVIHTLPARKFFVYTNGVRNDCWLRVYAIKELNKMSYFEIYLAYVTPTEKTNIQEGKTVKIYSGNYVFLKGRITGVEYETDYGCTIKGYGMEIKLKDDQTDRSTIQYTNTACNTIVSAVLSGISDVEEGTNDYTSPVSLRGEYDNKLFILSNLADNYNLEWWMDENYLGYDNFNISTSKYSTSSAYTFKTSESGNTSTVTKYKKNTDDFANYVTVLGYGDGINQIYSTIYHATDNRTTLNQSAGYISSTDSTITVADASKLPSSGTVWIGMEKVAYTGKSGNDLTGCSRGQSGGLDAYRHNNGVAVWDAQYTESSPEAGSSIDINKLKKTNKTKRNIIEQDALDRYAQRILDDLKDPVESITIDASEPSETVPSVDAGHYVTVIDTNTELNGDYQVIREELNIDYEEGREELILECSNSKVRLTSDLSSVKDDTENSNKYMQGATNIYALSEKENCDNSYPLNMRFYIPDDAIAINSVKLKFTTQKFRAYNSSSQTASSTGSPHTHSLSLSTETSNNSGSKFEAANAGTAQSVSNIDAIAPTVVDFNHHCYVFTIKNESGVTRSYEWEIYDVTDSESIYSGTITNLPDNAGKNISRLDLTDRQGHTIRFDPDTSGNNYGATLVACVYTYPYHSHTIDLSGSTAQSGGSGHTHDITMSFGIYEDSFPAGSPQVAVEVGSEGGESAVTGSPFSISDGGIESVDITDEVKAVGAGNWCNIKFTPQGGSDHNRIRIEANAYVQVFIKSE